MQFDLSLNCIAEADVKKLDYSATSLPPTHPVTGFPYIEHDATGVASGTIEMTKTVHNNGPWGPVSANAASGGAIVAYTGMNPGLADCVLAGGGVYPQVVLDVSVPVVLGPETYTLTCGRGGIEWDDDGDGLVDEDTVGGPGVDNDSDGLMDEDPCDLIDNDGDTTADEDDPAGDDDCDGAIDEDSPFYIVTLALQDGVEPPNDPHVIDPDPTNNSISTVVSIAVVRSFTADFAHYATSTDPEQQTKPIVDPPPGPWPGNNLRCEEMVVEAIPAGEQADKQVTDIDFDWGDQYPCAGQSLPFHNPGPPFEGRQTFSVNVSHPTYLSVTSMEYNAGPYQPDNAEISFFADIPANCEGRWVVDPNVNPLDIRTTLGDPNVGSSGTPVGAGDPMEPGDGNPLTWESDLHFYTPDYKMTEPNGVTLPITRFFEIHCYAEDMYEFQFCNRADVQPPEVDPVPGNELVCEKVWVLTPFAPGCPNTDVSVYDTWTDCKEVHIGTDYLDDCPDVIGHHALPPDQNADAWVDILDVLMYKFELPKAWPCP